MKNSLDELTIKLETPEYRVSDLRNRSIKKESNMNKGENRLKIS